MSLLGQDGLDMPQNGLGVSEGGFTFVACEAKLLKLNNPKRGQDVVLVSDVRNREFTGSGTKCEFAASAPLAGLGFFRLRDQHLGRKAGLSDRNGHCCLNRCGQICARLELAGIR